MNLTSLVIQLDAWAREELAAQKELAGALGKQEQAIAKNDADAMVASGDAVEALLKRGPVRERRRRDLMDKLSRVFGVAADTLTLGSIAQRAADQGVSVDNLLAVREELRKESALVLRTGRRIASLARYHQAFLGEVLRIMAPGEGEADEPVLLDARG